MAVEYVGPNRFRWTEKQLQIVNTILQVLPEEKKRLGKSLRSKFSYDILKGYLEEDPTEAIRSEDIVPLFFEYFRILEMWDMGGTILHLLFCDIVKNFKNTMEDVVLIKILCLFEKTLIESNILPSDFKLLIAEK